MADIISVRIDSDLQKAISIVEKRWKADRSEVVRRLLVEAVKSWKIQNAMGEIMAGKISIGKAAEECEISIWEMVSLLKEKNINWTGYGEEDIRQDLEILK